MNEFDVTKIIITTDKLGTITGRNIISFYEYPRIFSAVSNNNIIYVFAEYIADSYSYSWIACTTTEQFLDELNEGVLTIQQLFFSSSNVFLVKLSKNDEVAQVVHKECVPDDCFISEPLIIKGFMHENGNGHLETVQDISRKTNSTVVSFVAKKNKDSFVSVDLDELKSIVDTFKSMFSSFGFNNKQSLCLAGGSTLVNIIIEEDVDGDGESFVDIFERISRATTIDDILSLPKVSKKKVDSFKKFNSVAVDEYGDAEFIFARKGKKPSFLKQSSEQIKAKDICLQKASDYISRKIEEDIIYRVGFLNGILTEKNKFEFTSADDEFFSGTLGEKINPNDSYFVNGKEYSVAIEKKKAKNGKVSYKLLSVGDSTHLF